MPELPEVETVKNVLKKEIIGLKINAITINYPDMIKTNLDDFQKLVGEKFLDISRLGKWLIFKTTNYYLVSHLRMEGKYYYTKELVNKHDHIIFKLNNSYNLIYNDVRKFGVMYLVTHDKLLTTPIKELGLEPFSSDLTPSYLKEKYKGKKTPIKTSLLDQSIITGIGNIYADEILFKSHIYPLTKSCELTDKDCSNIINNTKEILMDAIKYKGTTIKSYTSSLGVFGSYQDKLAVHTKNICQACKSKIEVIKVSGRTTYYCPNCQVKDE